MLHNVPLPEYPLSWSISCGCGWSASSATRPGALVLAEHHETHHTDHQAVIR